jgi:hypothetical protein
MSCYNTYITWISALISGTFKQDDIGECAHFPGATSVKIPRLVRLRIMESGPVELVNKGRTTSWGGSRISLLHLREKDFAERTYL